MTFLFPSSASPKIQTHSRLMHLAALFVFLLSLTYTFAACVRLHTWTAPLNWLHWFGFTVWMIGFTWLYRQLIQKLPDCDPYFLPLGALMSGWGLLTIWRLDQTLGLRQSIWLAVCIALFISCLRIPGLLNLLKRYRLVWISAGLLLTALTILLGTYPGGIGPRLWLGCCGVYLQPSEPLKFLLIIFLAAYLSQQLILQFNWFQLLAPTLVLVGVAVAILITQRDLGTATLFLVLYAGVLFLATAKRRILFIFFLTITTAGIIGYQLFDVIRQRVEAWLIPWNDPSGRSYQIVQSLISVANGGVFGQGFGLGSPGIVPVSYSDFIFTSVVEETGLLGGLAVILLFIILAERGLMTAIRAPNLFQRLLASGVTIYLVSQSALIIAGNLRILPLTGVTLPFFSYGGSSLVTSFVCLLVLCLVSSQPEHEPAPLPKTHPYNLALGLSLLGFSILALSLGWWGLIQKDDLLARKDNPRWTINDRFVIRGALLDRKNTRIAETIGKAGNYERLLNYPALSPTIGYAKPRFGLAGLEASLDLYLRGLQGNPSSTILVSELLYGQPPPGLDIRLSLDLSLQQLADNLLANHKGAIVLLNARSGEVLVLASHPYFNANLLELKQEEWLKDANAPFLNRATQGQYPPGTALAPFILAETSVQRSLPALPENFNFTFENRTFTCVQPLPSSPEWNLALRYGCPAAILTLGRSIAPGRLLDLFDGLGLMKNPDVPLPTGKSLTIQGFNNQDLALLGQEKLTVSPLQMALAAASLSADGIRPSPRLSMAVHTPHQGWVIFPSGSNQAVFPSPSALNAIKMLEVPGSLIWQNLGSAFTAEDKITWYLAGTLPEWKGIPLALALVLEEDNPSLAQEIGSSIIQTPILP